MCKHARVCTSVYVSESIMHTFALASVFRHVGGVEAYCIQHIGPPGRCVGFRALAEE